MPSSFMVSISIRFLIPLKKFNNLCENDFNALICLLAGEKLTSYKPAFLIKNGEMLNVMFRVFYNKQELDIIDFINKLSHYNIKNCVTLHQSHFDLSLLDFLIENRESDDPNIPQILETIIEGDIEPEDDVRLEKMNKLNQI